MMVKTKEFPKFKNESEEADWWASAAGRAFAKRRSAEMLARGKRAKGSPILARMIKERSTQIAIRIPNEDLAEARRIAERKGVGYQTLIKMIVHEGLNRENQLEETAFLMRSPANAKRPLESIKEIKKARERQLID